MSLSFTLFDARLASLRLQQVILLFLWRVSEPHFLRPSQTSKYYELCKKSSQDFFLFELAASDASSTVDTDLPGNT